MVRSFPFWQEIRALILTARLFLRVRRGDWRADFHSSYSHHPFQDIAPALCSPSLLVLSLSYSLPRACSIQAHDHYDYPVRFISDLPQRVIFKESSYSFFGPLEHSS